MKFIRRIYRLLWLGLHILRAVFMMVFRLGPDPGHRTKQDWLMIMQWMRDLHKILGIHVSVSGEPINPPTLLVCNHISWHDIVVIQAVVPTGFVGKFEIRGWPLIGWMAHCGNTLFIRRGKRESLPQLCEAMASRIKARQNILIFPEGTTTAGDGVATFKTRLYEPAIALGVPIQPVMIYYRSEDTSCRELAFIGDESFVAHLWRILGEKRIYALIHFCKPVETKESDRRQLGKLTQAEVEAALATFQGAALSTEELDKVYNTV